MSERSCRNPCSASKRAGGRSHPHVPRLVMPRPGGATGWGLSSPPEGARRPRMEALQSKTGWRCRTGHDGLRGEETAVPRPSIRPSAPGSTWEATTGPTPIPESGDGRRPARQRPLHRARTPKFRLSLLRPREVELIHDRCRPPPQRRPGGMDHRRWHGFVLTFRGFQKATGWMCSTSPPPGIVSNQPASTDC